MYQRFQTLYLLNIVGEQRSLRLSESIGFMRIFKDIQNLPAFTNSVLTIGSFDGVHYGHQQILKHINRLAKEVKGESILITFHPHPRLVLGSSKNNQLFLLNTIEEKLNLLRNNQIDNVIMVPFTRDFSQQSPEAYVKDFLVDHFQPKIIVIGYDHKFGKNRKGDLSMLQIMAKSCHFEVEEISQQQIKELSVSSTKIRNALLNGKVNLANHLLGYTYKIKGYVVKGNQLGRKIGFPTANIKVEDDYKLIPANGVYAVNLSINKTYYIGMLNIGLRPTIDGEYKTIEVHIFDFDKNNIW